MPMRPPQRPKAGLVVTRLKALGRHDGERHGTLSAAHAELAICPVSFRR